MKKSKSTAGIRLTPEVRKRLKLFMVRMGLPNLNSAVDHLIKNYKTIS